MAHKVHIMKVKTAITLILLALSAIHPGCRENARQEAAKPDTTVTRAGRVKLGVGQSYLWVEVADNEAVRQQGLMFRREMPEDEGMLFVFEYPQPLSFWMRNTYLPLDIAYVGQDGVILNILAMKPLDEGPRYNSKGPAMYAIEANQGWFKRHTVKTGDRIRF